MRRRWCFVLLLLPSIAAAQMLDIRPGTRVKVRAPGAAAGTLVGVVSARNGDSITVLTSAPAAQYRVPVSSIATLSVSSGRSAAQGGKKGLLWGLGVGAAFGVMTCFDSTMTKGGGGDNRTQMSKGAYISEMAFGSAIIGTLIGAFVGAESWSDYELPAHIAAGPAGARIGASFRF